MVQNRLYSRKSEFRLADGIYYTIGIAPTCSNNIVYKYTIHGPIKS